MLDIDEVQIFLAAAEAGSFSAAARRLQMSQPAVSMQIRSLEKRLGGKLFSRAGRHIRLTEAGEALIPMARELVHLSTYAEETIASLQGQIIGLLKLACSTTAGKYVLPRLFAGFVARYPGVRVTCHVVSGELALDLLRQGEAHIVITSLREPYKDLEYRPLITEPVVLITPPDHCWARRGLITVDELTQGRFIAREVTSGTQQAVIQALAEHDLPLSALNTVMTLGNSEAIYLAVAEGIGVAFVSRRAAAEGIASGRVAEVAVEGLAIVQQLYLVRHASRAATSAQAAFWEHVYAPENKALLAQHEGQRRPPDRTEPM